MAVDMRLLARRAYFGLLRDIAARQTRLVEAHLRHQMFGADAIAADPMFHRLDTLDPLVPANFEADMAKRRAEHDALVAEARELGRLLVADNDAAWGAAINEIRKRHGV